ncbi:thiol-disulfide oxidoreductase [Nibricoccus aquaticus]|uniref:Thiol-disulfide oxidoreductase n=1 Tax=Nibricoccus aquaticus TaxID=2576891 RepID=A0A290QEW0_9BACT|nr:DCC1-like thiol-disulfide oxidoreductase family protein [Nibricoccus aquaticus]ATC63868.1 thiol-disulfide oxidoreductase [Nibricoccus aquaticus]
MTTHVPETALRRTPLLMYDGTCGLCNACVRLLLRIDKAGTLRFAPLQGPTAQAILRERGLPTEDFDSLIFVPDFPRKDGPHWSRTDGVLQVLAELGGVWRVVSWLRVIPRWLRDPLYKVVARLRYRLFGEYRPRPLAKVEWAARFLP